MLKEAVPQTLLLSDALHEAATVARILSACSAVSRVELAGEPRRGTELVGLIPLVVCSSDFAAALAQLAHTKEIDQITQTGNGNAKVIMTSGIHIDLHLTNEQSFPHLLLHLTGSAKHLAAVQERALGLGIRMTRTGMLRCGLDVDCRGEEDIYRVLELDFIPPELREGMGEVEASEQRKLPVLVEGRDLKGLFHVHSDWSDGTDSLEDIVRRAENMGYEYIGISEHSRSAYYAGGLRERDVADQHAEIARLQEKYTAIRILKGIESDIMPDGSLDYDSSTLECFDFVIGSLHSSLGMDAAAGTRRVIRAMESPYMTMLGHPTARLLLESPGCPLDLRKIIDAAAANGVAIEINSNPKRLDLDWRMARYAGEKGVPVSINPDAHSAAELDDVVYGVGIARKAWLSRDQVLNTKDLRAILAYLQSRRAGKQPQAGAVCFPSDPWVLRPTGGESA